jgi:HSP20 family molecular chaperone IbpA
MNFGFDLFDMMDDFFAPTIRSRANYMTTDVKETENGYLLSVDLPGFDKNDLSLTLKDGYLTVSAKREENEDNDKYLRRERKMEMSRSFFVGKDLDEKDITAKYVNGTLELGVPKVSPKANEQKTIRID